MLAINCRAEFAKIYECFGLAIQPIYSVLQWKGRLRDILDLLSAAAATQHYPSPHNQSAKNRRNPTRPPTDCGGR